MKNIIAPLLIAASIPSISSADDFNLSAKSLTIPNDPYFECIERALAETFEDTYNAEASKFIYTTDNGPLYVFEHGTVTTENAPTNITTAWAQVGISPDGNVAYSAINAFNETDIYTRTETTGYLPQNWGPSETHLSGNPDLDERGTELAYELQKRAGICRPVS